MPRSSTFASPCSRGRAIAVDAAVKLHTQMDLRGSIPTIVQITEGKRADVTFLDDLVLEPGAISIRDRGYVDFARLHRFTEEAAFFVTRTKRGMRFRRRTSRPSTSLSAWCRITPSGWGPPRHAESIPGRCDGCGTAIRTRRNDSAFSQQLRLARTDDGATL